MVWRPPNHNNYFCCCFATVILLLLCVNRNVNIWYFQWSSLTPEREHWTPKGLWQPTGWELLHWGLWELSPLPQYRREQKSKMYVPHSHYGCAMVELKTLKVPQTVPGWSVTIGCVRLTHDSGHGALTAHTTFPCHFDARVLSWPRPLPRLPSQSFHS